MGKVLIPSVRIWKMPDNPDTICFASYHAKKNQFVKKPVLKEIKVLEGPLYDPERKRWRLLRKEVLDELSHLPVGGGVILHIIKRSKWFNRGEIYGLGKTIDLATVNGHHKHGWARGQTYYDAGRVEDHGRITIGEQSRFFWVEKAGETREVERTIKVFSGKVWFKSDDTEPGYAGPGVGMGLRG